MASAAGLGVDGSIKRSEDMLRNSEGEFLGLDSLN